ncbi:MAG: hypothetical protein NTZ78_02310 [Candidatus Aureabacteria bacterium]|nr:hypothetical protein [Candidatus Auribacterota bacterium]
MATPVPFGGVDLRHRQAFRSPTIRSIDKGAYSGMGIHFPLPLWEG